MLQCEWWVPGSSTRAESAKYAGKSQYREILTITLDTCSLWITRATEDQCSPLGPAFPTPCFHVPLPCLQPQDFKRRVEATASTKAKDSDSFTKGYFFLNSLWLFNLPPIHFRFTISLTLASSPPCLRRTRNLTKKATTFFMTCAAFGCGCSRSCGARFRSRWFRSIKRCFYEGASSTA